MAVLTSNYPTSLDTVTTLGEVSNRAKSTLTVALTSGAETQISLSDASAFPSSGVISIDNEIFYYSAKVSNVLTIEARARQGTVAASHSIGAIGYLRLTKGHWEVSRTALISLQTKIGIGSNTPVSGTFLKGTGTGTSDWIAVTKTDVGLSAVENTALSTWAGSANITTLGTIGTGTWSGTAIADNKIASALTGKTYNGLTLTSTTGTFTLTNAKTLSVTNSLTLSGTDGTTMTFPSTSATLARTDAANTFTGTQTFSSTITGSISGNAATVTTNANLTGNVTSTGNATTIAAGVVTLGMMSSLAANSIIGNNTGAGATPIALSTTQVKTLLSLNNVENTALSTWAGTSNITTLGTIGTGTWNATTIADAKIATALTGKTYNGLTLTSTTGTFTLTAAKTLAVTNSLTLSGTDGTTMTFPATTASVARIDAAQTFAGVQTFSGKILSSVGSSGVGLDLSTSDAYADMRVIRNSTGTADKNLYIGYGSGATSSLLLYANNVELARLTGTGLAVGSGFAAARSLQVVSADDWQVRIGAISNYYDIGRSTADGLLHFSGNQGGVYTGYDFNGPITIPDSAYGSGWDGSLQVPTKNAVYDRIETVTGNVKYLADYGSNTTAIAAAITAIGSTATDLYVTAAFQTSTNHTFHDNTRLIFLGNGLITINAGHTVIVGQMLDPGNRKVFHQTNFTSHIRFRRGAVYHMNVTWLCGNTNIDVPVDCTDAINEFLNSIRWNSSGIVFIPEGLWLSQGSHILPMMATIRGAGIGLAGSGTTLRLTKANSALFIKESLVINTKIEHIVLECNNLTNSYCFWFHGAVANCTNTSFDSVKWMNCTTGVMMDGTASPTANVYGGNGGPWNISFIYLNSADSNYYLNPPTLTVNSGGLTGGTAIVSDIGGNVTRIQIPTSVTAGTFTITVANSVIGTQTTSPIAFNANTSAVTTALEALASVADTVATTGWQIASVSMDNYSLFENCTHSGIRCNTSNSAMLCEANFNVPTGAWAIYQTHSGSATYSGNEFAGSTYYGQNQMEKITVVCPSGTATADSVMQTVVTKTSTGGFPATTYVAIKTGDTPTMIARKFRDALDAHPHITYYFRIGGTNAEVLLCALDPAANDAALNFTLEVVGGYPACGVTGVSTSSNYVTGVAVGNSMAKGVFYSGGGHGVITFVGTQDEGFENSIINDANSFNQQIVGIGATFQAPIRLNQGTRLNLFGCTIQNKMIRDGAGGSVVTSIGTMVVTTWSETSSGSQVILDFLPTLTNFSAAAGGSARVLLETLSGGQAGSESYDISTKMSGPANACLPYGYEGMGRAAMELGAQGSSAALLVGTSTDAGAINNPYTFRRETADDGLGNIGYLKISGTQAGYTGFVFNGPVKTTDNTAYGSGWNGSTVVPTRDAVYDKIETLGSRGEALGTRIGGTTSSSTPTPDMDSVDIYSLTALAAGATFGAPTGTLVNGRKLMIRIKDNGSARSLAWNSIYVAGGSALPSTTVAGKILHLGFIYNTDNGLNKWMLIASSQEA